MNDIENKEHHEVNYIRCQCSTSHTFGNVTAFVQNWLINLFPENTFKTLHVNSKIAHLQLRSTPKEFLKKQPPMFIIRPRIDWNETNKFLNGTAIIEPQVYYYSSYGMTNLQDFFQDNKSKVALKYQLNRQVMTFDVVLVFNTLMQQINWSNYILNTIKPERPFFLDTCLESYISPELLKQLSDVSGVPLEDENGSNAQFLRYMNGNSAYPVTYKLQGSTGREEYYRYYPVRIDTMMTNFSTDEGEKVGQVMDRYQISFSLRCEFYCTGFYFLFSDKLSKKNCVTVGPDDSASIIPLFTDVLLKEDIDLPLGWKLFASPSCKLENPDDTVPIESLFNESIKTAIKFHIDRGMPVSEFFKLKVRKQGKLLEYGKDYDFDFDTYTLRFHKCNTYYTYKILITINVEYINKLVKDVYELK